MNEPTSGTPGVAAVEAPSSPMPFDEAAVFTIWQGMQFQGGITNRKLAELFARQVLAAHGLGDVPTYGVSRTDAETICHKPPMPPKDRP